MIDRPKCKCGGEMFPGLALIPTYGGTPDFPGGAVATVSAVGSRITPCLKCQLCGHSITDSGDLEVV